MSRKRKYRMRNQNETTEFEINNIEIDNFDKQEIFGLIDSKLEEIEFEKYADNVYIVVTLRVPLPEDASEKQKKSMIENNYPERVTAQSLLIESFNYTKKLVVEKPFKAMGQISTKYTEEKKASLIVSISPGLIID
jgi:hypothetical protein